MTVTRINSSLFVLSVWLVACGESTDASRNVGVASEPLSACNETVPDNRYIDGIPAYAQCTATESSAIYSNNGIDTATASMGSDWVRTQYSGGYQCTELAHRYLYFKWQVKWIPNGNAGTWCDTAPPANSGVTQTMTPGHGDLMVLAPGSCGADASAGHVTVVDSVDSAKARLTVVEQNGARRGQYMQSCGKCFLHVIANDGMNPGTAIAAPPVNGIAGAPATTAGSGAAVAGAQAPTSKRPAPAAGSNAPMQPTAAAPAAPIAGTQAPTAGQSAAGAGSVASTPMTPTTPTTAGSGTVTTTMSPPANPAGAADGGCSVSSTRGTVGSARSWSELATLAIAWAVFARRRRTGHR